MLELQKFVLQQVADDRALFKKELQKSNLWLTSDELELLRDWVLNQYGDIYADIIQDVFYVVETNP